MELPDEGIAGSVELTNVEEGEIIEIEIDPGIDSLTLAVVRRAAPVFDDFLPEDISENNLSISLPAGVFDLDLTVLGNNFFLAGEAGGTCTGGEDEGWTTIGGIVDIRGNAAIFRNIKFLGPVTVVSGNGSHFINCCFDGDLIVFGETPIIVE